MKTKHFMVASLLVISFGCKKKYQEGYNAGYDVGHDEGYAETYDSGYSLQHKVNLQSSSAQLLVVYFS